MGYYVRAEGSTCTRPTLTPYVIPQCPHGRSRARKCRACARDERAHQLRRKRTWTRQVSVVIASSLVFGIVLGVLVTLCIYTAGAIHLGARYLVAKDIW